MADEIEMIKELVDAAFMAANDLVDFQRGAMRGLLGQTSEKIGKVSEEFTEVYCGGYVDPDDVADMLTRKASPEPIAEKASKSDIADRIRLFVPVHRELKHVSDEMNAAVHLIDVAWTAADNLLEKEERDPLRTVLSVAHGKITAACDRLTVAVGGAQPARTRMALDPVFAAIKRHKAAWDALPAVLAAVDEVAAEKQGREITAADKEAHRQAHDDLGAARDEFEATIPTTTAGLRAALEYAIEIDRDCIPEVGGRIAPALLKSPLFA
jgi:hypothetical protein